MKTNEKKSVNKKTVTNTSDTVQKTDILSVKILAYCGYKLVGNKLVSTGNYNPVPYEGL